MVTLKITYFSAALEVPSTLLCYYFMEVMLFIIIIMSVYQLMQFFTAISNNGRDLTVDFPQQPGWTGQVSEMELVTDQRKLTL